MVCTHLKELYELCDKHNIRLGGTDLVRIVCKQCDQDETCPSTLMAEYDARHPDEAEPHAKTDDLTDSTAH